MKFLAIDCSTKFLHVALFDNSRIIHQSIFAGDIGFEESIMKAIHETINPADIADLDFLAVGKGPGNFTGLRISGSVMQAFSLSHKKPLIGFSSIDAIIASRETGELVSVAMKNHVGSIAIYTYEQKAFQKSAKVTVVDLEAYLSNNDLGVVIGDQSISSCIKEGLAMNMSSLKSYMIALFFKSLPLPEYI